MTTQQDRVLVAGHLCHDGNGNILLHKRGPMAKDHQGTWDWGGGGVEAGETIAEAVHRELSEEYGCNGIIEQTLPVCTFTNPAGVFLEIHNHLVRVDPNTVSTTEPSKVTDIGWYSIDALPEPMHPGCRSQLGTIEQDLRTSLNI